MNQRLLNHGNPSLLAFTSASQQKTIYSTKEDAFALPSEASGAVATKNIRWRPSHSASSDVISSYNLLIVPPPNFRMTGFKRARSAY